MIAELQMHLHVFAHIARGALANWWHSTRRHQIPNGVFGPTVLPLNLYWYFRLIRSDRVFNSSYGIRFWAEGASGCGSHSRGDLKLSIILAGTSGLGH